jgi:cytidyltransferase-like protein
MATDSLHASSQEALGRITQAAQGRRVVFVSGNFNIVHPGHLRLLRFAKECGDFLVVGVQDSRSAGAYLIESHRLEGVQAIQWVDHAFVLRDPPSRFLEALRPPVVVKGSSTSRPTPRAAVLAARRQAALGSGDISFSSLDLMRQEWRASTLHPEEAGGLHVAPRPGRGPGAGGPGRWRLRVCVIGDTIGQYISCDPLGMSQEDAPSWSR